MLRWVRRPQDAALLRGSAIGDMDWETDKSPQITQADWLRKAIRMTVYDLSPNECR